MAIGAVRAIHEAGLRVPEDISVVGLDDIEVAAYQNPPFMIFRSQSRLQRPLLWWPGSQARRSLHHSVSP